MTTFTTSRPAPDGPVYAERYLIADNRHVERGGWLQDELKTVLTDFASNGGLRGTGYDEDDLDAMMDDDDYSPGQDDPVGGGKEVECPECGHTFKPT